MDARAASERRPAHPGNANGSLSDPKSQASAAILAGLEDGEGVAAFESSVTRNSSEGDAGK
jgi:hypothetical protein